MRQPPRLRFTVPFLAISLGILCFGGCSQSQLDSFGKAMTGHAPTTQPGGVATIDQSNPSPNSVEGVTQTIGQAAGIGAAVLPIPVGGYAAVIAAAASGLLVLERFLVNLGLTLPNSKGSQSQSSSGSGGGQSSGSGGPSSSSGLKPAA